MGCATSNDQGNTLLHFVVDQSQLEVIPRLTPNLAASYFEVLCARGADMGIKNCEGKTPADKDEKNVLLAELISAKFVDADQVQQLMESTDGATVLVAAAFHDPESVRTLLDYDISPRLTLDATTNSKGQNALMLATLGGYTARMERLITVGASLDTINQDGKSALLLALEMDEREKKIDVVNVLLKHGASVTDDVRRAFVKGDFLHQFVAVDTSAVSMAAFAKQAPDLMDQKDAVRRTAHAMMSAEVKKVSVVVPLGFQLLFVVVVVVVVTSLNTTL